MPAPRKPPGTRADERPQRQHAEIVVLRERRLDPEPRPEWLQAQREDWAAVFREPPGWAVTPASLPALYRLFELRDEVALLLETIGRVGRFTAGSKGQPVANPAYTVLLSLLAEVRQLEDRFGLAPASALRLGFRVEGDEGPTLRDLAAAAGPVPVDGDE